MNQLQSDFYFEISQNENQCDYLKGYSVLRNNSLVKLKDSLL